MFGARGKISFEDQMFLSFFIYFQHTFFIIFCISKKYNMVSCRRHMFWLFVFKDAMSVSLHGAKYHLKTRCFWVLYNYIQHTFFIIFCISKIIIWFLVVEICFDCLRLKMLCLSLFSRIVNILLFNKINSEYSSSQNTWETTKDNYPCMLKYYTHKKTTLLINVSRKHCVVFSPKKTKHL